MRTDSSRSMEHLSEFSVQLLLVVYPGQHKTWPHTWENAVKLVLSLLSNITLEYALVNAYKLSHSSGSSNLLSPELGHLCDCEESFWILFQTGRQLPGQERHRYMGRRTLPSVSMLITCPEIILAHLFIISDLRGREVLLRTADLRDIQRPKSPTLLVRWFKLRGVYAIAVMQDVRNGITTR